MATDISLQNGKMVTFDMGRAPGNRKLLFIVFRGQDVVFVRRAGQILTATFVICPRNDMRMRKMRFSTPEC